MALCRTIIAFFISPAGAIGTAVVAETFFKNARARYLGIWTLLLTLGVPVAPFIFGFVAQWVGYRWIYYTLAITNGLQLPLSTLLGPETHPLRKDIQHSGPKLKQEYFTFPRIDPKPLRFSDFAYPLTLFAVPCVLIAAGSIQHGLPLRLRAPRRRDPAALRREISTSRRRAWVCSPSRWSWEA